MTKPPKKSVIEMYTDILEGTRTRFPNRTWTDIENVKSVVIFLIEKKLNWNKEDIRNNLSWNTFVEYKLSGLLSDEKFKGSPYRIINAVYPDTFKPWELKRSPMNTWDEETAIKACKWLFESKLKWTITDIKQNFTIDVLKEHNLSGLIEFCQGSPYNLLKVVYPHTFKPWDLKCTSWRFFHKDENILEALQIIAKDLNKQLEQLNSDEIINYIKKFIHPSSKSFLIFSERLQTNQIEMLIA